MKNPRIKRITIVLLIISLIGIFLYLNSPFTNPKVYITNTDPALYKKCVQEGGEVNETETPSFCIQGDEKYFNGK